MTRRRDDLDRLLLHDRTQPVECRDNRRPIAEQRGPDRSEQADAGQSGCNRVGNCNDVPILPDQRNGFSSDVDREGNLPEPPVQSTTGAVSLAASVPPSTAMPTSA